MTLALALWLSLSSYAGELAGVTLPDTVQAGGQTLVLNGMGLREKYFIDVYVGGLYLPAKSSSPDQIINLDAPKRVVMHFIYSKVTKAQMMETLQEGVDKYPQYASLKPQMDEFANRMTDVVKGDEVVIDYQPGSGTSVIVRGKNMGTTPGVDFMKLVFSIYVGSNPANEKLKQGMLGK